MKSYKSAGAALIIAGLAAGITTLRAGAQEPAPVADKPVASQPVEAKYDDELMIWTLGEQTWEFGELETAYLPAKGEFNPATREAVWTFQLVKDMTPGEVGLQSTLAGSPFKPTFLDADKILIAGDARVTITPITGKLGDAIRVTIRMPAEATLVNVALIRLERRTQIGF